MLSDQIHPFAIQRPPGVLSPDWDLDIVLRALRSPPYEPLAATSFRTLTKKCLFLLALATSKKVGEIQALSPRIAGIGGDMSLAYSVSFVYKTESHDHPLPLSFVLKSLRDFVGELEEETLLCSVHSLSHYLRATWDLSPCFSLFVSPRCRSRAICKNAISFLPSGNHY